MVFIFIYVSCSLSRFMLREKSSWPGKKLIDGKLYESDIKTCWKTCLIRNVHFDTVVDDEV